MEVLRRGGGIGKPDVALRRERDEALDARARVLGARALVAVGEQQREARLLPPLRLAGGDEAVDDHLRPVREVAELRLPQHEAFGSGGGILTLDYQGGPVR